MKQILQDLSDGGTRVVEVPAPSCGRGEINIETRLSLISAGTERMLVETGRASLIDKARKRPDQVKQVLAKVRTDGVLPAIEAVRARLEQPLELGYCNVGRVLEVGQDVEGFTVGDRVASNGKHAEIVSVPRNLVAAIPDDVDDETAAFTVLGSIALQGIRLAQPTLGETFVVTGLGLVGLLAVQILRANGCRVLAVDTNSHRVELAALLGADVADLSKGDNPVDLAMAVSRGRGVDGVILTASTASSEPVSQAARMCRKRGRIVLVGVTGLELDRSDFYEKELTFQVSCSYGPGRYDPGYEAGGKDYPVGFVRWTEQRNFEAVLDMMASGAIDVSKFITHRFPIDDAPAAYDLLVSKEPSLGIVIHFPYRESAKATIVDLAPEAPRLSGRAITGFIGAGNYGGRVLFKAFRASGAGLHTVVSAKGTSAARHGRKFGFRRAGSESAAVLETAEIDSVCISTRHDSHARFVRAALASGKHVFVEKPLCLTLEELSEIEADVKAVAGRQLLMVGFNRRFAPMIVKAKSLLAKLQEPKSFLMTVNAGAIPVDHWTQDPKVGGGRIIGEACHFIDLLRHLAGAPVRSFDATGSKQVGGPARSDVATITLRFEDGSFGVINYLANGHRDLSKERLEVFCGGRVLALDNFRTLRGYGWPEHRTTRSWSQDKGQAACVAAFVDAVRTGGAAPIPLDQILEVSRISIEAANRIS